MPKKPLLAFTMGDPGGIGPEVAVKAMRSSHVWRACRILAIGSRGIFWRAGWRPGLAPLLETASQTTLKSPPKPYPTAVGGRDSYAAVCLGLSLVARRLVAGLVTAPISKESWAMAGIRYKDHTDFLADATRCPDAGMMLIAGPMRAALATRHLPLARVSASLSPQRICCIAELAERSLRVQLGIRPHLGLCALNPHAGDGGLLGQEEKRLLKPAISSLRRKGLRIDGPLAADAAWVAHAAGRYDALIALYHDQALIPLKLKAGYGIVNWTMGVPVMRTAPGHGTAFDIAGRGLADPSGMIAAALWAARHPHAA